eukprot:gene27815-34594_t
MLIAISSCIGCPYLRRSTMMSDDRVVIDNDDNYLRKLSDSSRRLSAGICAKTNGASLVSSKAGTCVAYKGMQAAFDAATSDSLGALVQSNIFGIAVRLAFHDAGEFDQTSSDLMGSDGCLSDSTDNAGLVELTSLVNTIIEPVWQQYCDSISRADFWVLWAKLSAEKADPTGTLSIAYQYGRKDNSECDAGEGRLPSGAKGMDEITRVFVTQMGLTLNDALTLSGAHTLGHVHIANSGYGFLASEVVSDKSNSTTLNAWDATPNQFDNDYFVSMYIKPWVNKAASTSGLNQWGTGGPSIGLNADMALFYTPDLTNDFGTLGQICEPNSASLPGQLSNYGCTLPSNTAMPSTATLAGVYADTTTGNAAFLAGFSVAFPKMVSVGYGVPLNVDGATSSGKLGTLTAIDLSTCPNTAPSVLPTSSVPTASPTTSKPTSAVPSPKPTFAQE